MKILFPIFIFIISFFIYYLTGFQDLTYTDNGELAGVATTLGISHPTGYPLFTLLSHIWSNIPLNLKLIHQLNLFSAFFVSLSAVLVYFNSLLLLSNYIKINEIGRNIVAMSFAFSYCFGSLIWEQSSSFEVYSLHFFFLNLIVYFALKLYFNFELKGLFLLVFISGLSFTNHLTTILITPSLLFLIFIRNDFKFRKYNIKILLYLFFTFLLGLSLYLYLPIRSSMEPMFNWGDVSRSWDKFLYHVQGKQYQVWMFTGVDAIKTNLAKLPGILFNQFHFIIILFFLGVYNLFKTSKYIFYFLIISAIVTTIYSSNYTIHDIDPYFALLAISMLYISLFGIIYLYKKFNNIIYISLILPLTLLIFNFNRNDVSEKDLVPLFTTTLVDNLDSNAIVISAQWDFWASAFWYKQKVEGYRKDVTLIEKELLRRTWYPTQLFKWYSDLAKSNPEKDEFMFHLEKFENEEEYDVMGIQTSFINLLKSFIDKNISERPVYVTYDILQTEQQLTNGYFLKPEGLAFRVYKNDVEYHSTKYENINIEEFLKNKSEYNNHLDEGMFDFLAITYINFSRFYLGKEDFDNALKTIEIARKISPENAMANQIYQQIK